MLSLFFLFFSVVLTWVTKEGFRIWWMCLFVALAVHECDTHPDPLISTAEDGRSAYVKGFEICQKADFPDVIVLKHYFPKDGHIDFMYYCVDSQGGLHISPDAVSKPVSSTQNVTQTPLPPASTPVSP
ncbi:MAG: hypothetical protein NTX72_01070 [Candidatus Uhrbacteria bacterium]|nr:hypothetical protein [Candidatus Uhrbacteria bacterium]